MALTRTMLLVDTAGDIERSTLTESVQLRAFGDASAEPRFDQRGTPTGRGFVEFRLLRRRLFAGEAGGLQALAPGEQAFIVFSNQGRDTFESAPHAASRGNALESCRPCHIRLYDGLAAINIAPHLLKPTPRFDYRHPRWSVYAQSAVDAKTRPPRLGPPAGFVVIEPVVMLAQADLKAARHRSLGALRDLRDPVAHARGFLQGLAGDLHRHLVGPDGKRSRTRRGAAAALAAAAEPASPPPPASGTNA